jgi:3-deoxy-D-manno-octulosonic-acid transferase
MHIRKPIGELGDWRLRSLILTWRIGFPLFFAFALPSALMRLLRRGNYREKFGERFGRFDSATAARLRTGGPWSLMHAVSVGEMLMALQLAEEWKKVEPDLNLVLTVTTTTGFAQARAKLQPWMELIYHPIDFTGAVRRTLGLVQPERIVFVEAAFWPNLLVEAKQRSIRCAIVNARMSPRSERRYRKFSAVARPLFSLLDLVCVQEQKHVDVWKLLGVAPEGIVPTGSIKFDVASPDAASVEERRNFCADLGIPPDAPVILGGSTWPGEEAVLARILKTVRQTHPNAVLILVPRHVERTAAIVGELTAMDLRVALRSGGGGTIQPDVLVVNTTGELRYWYPIGNVIFVGKSLFEEGGQNPVEAVITGRPVFSGPHMENFRDIVPALERTGALVRVTDEEALAAKISEALVDPPNVRECVNAMAKHAGATVRTAEALRVLKPV